MNRQAQAASSPTTCTAASVTLFIDSETQLRKYRAQLDATQAVALTPKASRDFIRILADDL